MDGERPRRERLPRRDRYIILGAILLTWTPALLFALGLLLVHVTGCTANEARAYPCVVAGLDIGGWLYTLTVLGWLVLPLLPFMALTLLLGVGAGLLALYEAWRR